MWGLWLAVALAGWAEDLRPVAAPWDTPDRWAAQATADRPVSPLVCDVLVPEHALLCFRVRDGERLRWVTAEDAAAWSVTTSDLRAAVKAAGRAKALAPEILDVGGMGASYRRWVDGEGWAVASLLWAPEVAATLGPDARFAIPAGTVAIAWSAGDGDVDKALAIGVVELAIEQPGEVSRTVFRFDGTRLVPFVEATPQPTP